MTKCSSCSKCGQFRVGRTRKKTASLKGGKIQRISARREFDAGAPIGTPYKVPNGHGGYNWKVLSLDQNKRPYLSNSKSKRTASFSAGSRKRKSRSRR